MLESHLSAGPRDAEHLPVASVKLILPDQDMPVGHGSERDRADLFVQINLPPVATGLPQWRNRFGQALMLPAQLARWLMTDLGVPTNAAADMRAEACVRLVARPDSPLGLTEVVDVSGFNTLPAPHVPREFGQCLVADPEGREIALAARQMAIQLAEALSVTGYEEVLVAD